VRHPAKVLYGVQFGFGSHDVGGVTGVELDEAAVPQSRPPGRFPGLRWPGCMPNDTSPEPGQPPTLVVQQTESCTRSARRMVSAHQRGDGIEDHNKPRFSWSQLQHARGGGGGGGGVGGGGGGIRPVRMRLGALEGGDIAHARQQSDREGQMHSYQRSRGGKTPRSLQPSEFVEFPLSERSFQKNSQGNDPSPPVPPETV